MDKEWGKEDERFEENYLKYRYYFDLVDDATGAYKEQIRANSIDSMNSMEDLPRTYSTV